MFELYYILLLSIVLYTFYSIYNLFYIKTKINVYIIFYLFQKNNGIQLKKFV